MSEGDKGLAQVIAYMKAHWPSQVKTEWQVAVEEYPNIAAKAIRDLCSGKTMTHKMVRITGVSGSGKTTQLLPAAEKYFEAQGLDPVLVAARKFVEYHPHYGEIKDYYGEENIRKMTDEFSTIMMFLCMKQLVEKGYDIILDVTLLDPEIEGILLAALKQAKYDSLMLMVAVSPEVAEKHLSGRAWRHTKDTEDEFVRATKRAFLFYTKSAPDMRIIMWNTYEKNTVYDGIIKDALECFEKYSVEKNVPAHDEKELKEAKLEYIEKI